MQDHHIGGLKLSFILFSIALCVLVIGAALEMPRIVEERSDKLSEQTPMRTNLIEIGGISVRVVIAETASQRTAGLSIYDGLGEREGMLFMFPKQDYHGIWMKNMKFPIDVIWINDAYQIVHIVTDMEPESYPEVFTPKLKAKYVLEVPAGFVERFSISESSYVAF
jgi:uncharacterized protein